MILIKVMYFTSIFLVFYTFVGYPVSLVIINSVKKKKKIIKEIHYKPFVSIIIPAHNEEKVILDKLNNLVDLNYPKSKYEIIIASDNSIDNTNELVLNFIQNNSENEIYLYVVKERKGKTNAQNEAVRTSKGEILIFSDTNSIIDKEAVNNLTSSFSDEDIIYVSGRLRYVNSYDSLTSNTENKYWNYDLFMREIESNIKTITAGNGALYAIRKDEYIEFDPMKSHDSAMPLFAALKKKRAIYNEDALAYEKAGENTEDEFNRKVRMNRLILTWIFGDFKKYNFFKYGWFSYFYFCHRTLRYSLFILQFLIFVTNILMYNDSLIYAITMMFQLVFYIIALLGNKIILKNKLFYLIHYYFITIYAQFIGAVRQITGKSKPFWEKAESTR